MLLLVDAGNTRIKWAVAPEHDSPATALRLSAGQTRCRLPTPPGQAWVAQGAVTHHEIGRLGRDWQQYGIDAIIVANVAGGVIAAALQQHFQVLVTAGGMPAMVRWFASSATAAGVRNGYREPACLGCDRMASLIGAHALWPGQALIVATCGTATTIDALSAEGQFTGGLILPGFSTMALSLAQCAAQLQQLPHRRQLPTAPALQGDLSAGLFADNTDDAIQQGCLAAQVGAIDYAVTRYGNARCILSGGAAHRIAPHLAVMPTLVDNLVLVGLEEVVRNDRCRTPD